MLFRLYLSLSITDFKIKKSGQFNQ